MSRSVVCPHCGTLTPNLAMTTLGEVQIDGSEGPFSRTREGMYRLITHDGTHAIVACQACERPFTVELWSAGVVRRVWPLRSRSAPEHVPPKVAEAYNNARLARAVGADLAALMAARTVIVRMLRDKLAAQLRELAERQLLTPALYGAADQVRLWAGVAGHDDIESGELKADEVLSVLDYLHLVLEAVYTHPEEAARLAQRTTELKKGTKP